MNYFNWNQEKKYLFRTFLEGEFKEGSVAKLLYEGGPLYIELDDNGSIDWDDPPSLELSKRKWILLMKI